MSRTRQLGLKHSVAWNPDEWGAPLTLRKAVGLKRRDVVSGCTVATYRGAPAKEATVMPTSIHPASADVGLRR